MKIIVLLTMIFLHIVDDFYLQGILANMKQKSWWEENAPQEKYRFDYIMALAAHAFSWTFMMMLPVLMWMISQKELNTTLYCVWFFTNWIWHFSIDNLKCNLKKINLIQDQSFHLIQIVITWLVIVVS